jgi:hypothetical protein
MALQRFTCERDPITGSVEQESAASSCFQAIAGLGLQRINQRCLEERHRVAPCPHRRTALYGKSRVNDWCSKKADAKEPRNKEVFQQGDLQVAS